MLDFRPAGDGALLVRFSQEISPSVNGEVRALMQVLERVKLRGFREAIPAFCTVLVLFDPQKTNHKRLESQLRRSIFLSRQHAETLKRCFVIPVCYDGEDLNFVAAHAGLTTEEVIRRHTAPNYLIYMLGFLPGFPYLGGLDPALHTPRLQTPRNRIPRGSVGIGGEQTGIYPTSSPGGWQLIGRTPVKLYDPVRAEIIYKSGDFIQFKEISPEKYQELEEKQGQNIQIWEVHEI